MDMHKEAKKKAYGDLITLMDDVEGDSLSKRKSGATVTISVQPGCSTPEDEHEEGHEGLDDEADPDVKKLKKLATQK